MAWCLPSLNVTELRNSFRGRKLSVGHFVLNQRNCVGQRDRRWYLDVSNNDYNDAQVGSIGACLGCLPQRGLVNLDTERLS